MITSPCRGVPFKDPSVACLGTERYSRPVRHRAFHYWTVIFFLVSRLIFGEFAHAMPHASASMNGTAVAASDADPPCSDHTRQPSSTHGEASDPDALTFDDHPVDDKDCCKKGGCVCPCLHTPAAALAAVVMLMPAEQSRPGALVRGADWLRTSMLFRPPAQLR
jgi:hypothetical protein